MSPYDHHNHHHHHHRHHQHRTLFLSLATDAFYQSSNCLPLLKNSQHKELKILKKLNGNKAKPPVVLAVVIYRSFGGAEVRHVCAQALNHTARCVNLSPLTSPVIDDCYRSLFYCVFLAPFAYIKSLINTLPLVCHSESDSRRSSGGTHTMSTQAPLCPAVAVIVTASRLCQWLQKKGG